MNDVNHWRDRAAEMRALATTTKDIEAHAVMIRLAAVLRQAGRSRRASSPRAKFPHEAGRPWAGLTSVIAVTWHGEVLGYETQARHHPYLPLTRSPDTPKAT